MALLTNERENSIRVALASVIMIAGAGLSFLQTETAYAFYPDMLQSATWAFIGGAVQLGVACAIWLKRFRKPAAIAFVLICSIQALFLYYHLIVSDDLAFRGASIIFLVLLQLLCIKAGLKIAMYSPVKPGEPESA